MISIHYTKKKTPYVWASELHKELNIKTPLRKWFPRMIDYGFIENEDYYQVDKNVRLVQGGYKIKHDWAVQLDMAKHIAMIQRTEKGKALRKYLIGLDKKVQEGLLLSKQQLSVLFELCEVFGYFSVQEKLEQNHYSITEFKKDAWWRYRAKAFGYSTQDLKEMMNKIGRKYKSQRQALFHIDKFELIRMASFDLFKAMGKTDEYAKNVSDFAKEIAQKTDPDIYDDRNTSIDFKPDEHKKTISKLDDRNKLLGDF